MSEVRERSWQNVQEKAFIAWMNETLLSTGIKISDLKTDLADGVRLAHFFQILSGKKIHTKIEPKPHNVIQAIQNLHIDLVFLEAVMGVKNPGTSAEEINSGNVKMILGLLWTLYRKYRIQTISVQDKSSEEGLLLWVKNVTEGYKDVHVENFKTSFKDGMAFLALVHRYNPDKTKVNLDDHTPESIEHNLSVAFELAEQELGIPKLLDAKDVFSGHVDERALVLYTSLFFHAYKASEELQKESERWNKSVQEKLEETLRLQRLVQEKSDLAEQFQQKNLELQRILEEERTEYSLKLEDYQKQVLELSEKLHEEQTRRLELDSKVVDLSSSLNETQETNLQVITELRKKQNFNEEEIEVLKNDVENFKAQLYNERKENNEHQHALQERTEQDTFHRKGLQVLHKNLDEHIKDLHTWQKYLDNSQDWLDFDRDVKPALNNELSTRESFVEELNLLSDKLEQENEAMLAILKAKLAGAKDAKIQETTKGEK